MVVPDLATMIHIPSMSGGWLMSISSPTLNMLDRLLFANAIVLMLTPALV